VSGGNIDLSKFAELVAGSEQWAVGRK